MLRCLASSAHELYKKDVNMYLQRRNRIYFSIWKLLKQIVINYRYLNKYYYSSEHSKCDICYLFEWLMEELKILNGGKFVKAETIDGYESLRISTVVHVLEYDYLGVLIILLTLASNECIQTMFQLTHKKWCIKISFTGAIWITAHKIVHNPTFIGNFFKESLRKIKKIKQKERRFNKCQWNNCKKRNCRKYYQCKICKITKYCGKQCQKLDWNKNHRIMCPVFDIFARVLI
eukprot:258575_1